VDIGSAMLFVLSLVACVIAGLFVVTCASQTFLNALYGTAAGNDEVPWSSDPFFDQFAESCFLGLLLALGSLAALGPAGLLFPDFLKQPFGAPLVVAGAAWLIFPILLLSALTGTSRLCVLHWECLRRLVRRPFALLLFYLSTGVSLFIGVAAAYLAVFYPHPLALVGAIVAAACVLIHARLVGRLAWILSETEVHKKSAKRRRLRRVKSSDPWKTPQETLREPSAAPEQNTAITAADPLFIPTAATSAALADAEEDEWTPNKKPYALLGDMASAALPPIPASNPARRPIPQQAITSSPRACPEDDEEETAPRMQPATPEPAVDRAQIKPELPEPDRIEMRWMENRRLPPLPRWPLLRGVWIFPFYPSTLDRLFRLSILSFILAVLIRFMIVLAGGVRGAL
jgi:hypothetical protein